MQTDRYTQTTSKSKEKRETGREKPAFFLSSSFTFLNLNKKIM